MLEGRHTKVKIKMLAHEMGADCLDDGRTLGTKHYEAGKEYEVGHRLAKDFCERMKVAEYCDKPAEKAPEKKALKGAPENKGA